MAQSSASEGCVRLDPVARCSARLTGALALPDPAAAPDPIGTLDVTPGFDEHMPRVALADTGGRADAFTEGCFAEAASSGEGPFPLEARKHTPCRISPVQVGVQ